MGKENELPITIWLPFNIYDLKEIFLSEIRKASFDFIISCEQGYRLSYNTGHACPPKPHKNNLVALECAYFQKQGVLLFTLTAGYF